MSIDLPLVTSDGRVIAYTLVDVEDAGRFARFTWRVVAGRYAGRWTDGGTTYLHRLIAGLERGDPREVDHINRNRFDNRRKNLRVVVRSQNGQNLPSQAGTSRFRGVCWDRRVGRWSAQVKLNRRKHHLGYFDSEEEAARVAADFRRQHMPYSEEALIHA